MIQTIVYLSITLVIFVVLFIITYIKYRKLERAIYNEFMGIIMNEQKIEALKEELDGTPESVGDIMADILGER